MMMSNSRHNIANNQDTNADEINNNNLNNYIYYDETQVATQLELLKEKLKVKDAEFEYILNNQKEEYEKTIRERDREVNEIVEHLLSENQELKRHIIDLEIELEQHKETISQYKKNYEMHFGEDHIANIANNIKSNNLLNNTNLRNNNNLNFTNLKKSQIILNNSNLYNNNNNNITNISSLNMTGMGVQDKLFLESVRLIKTGGESKQKEITDKYNQLIQNLIYDNKVTIENLKRINIDTKNKILQNRGDDGESFIPIKTLEEQITVYENKLKTLFEELKAKEKYINITELKSEMLNEENIFIKNKLAEEKKFLLMQINEAKKEHEQNHSKIIKKMEDDINQKKALLHVKVEESLKVNEDIVKNLIKEKEKIFEENKILKRKVETLNLEIEEIIQLKKKSDDNITKKEEELRTILINKKAWSEEYTKFSIEKNALLRSNEDMVKTLNEYIAKIAALENVLAQHKEKELAKAKEYEKGLIDYDNKYRLQIESLNNQIVDLERKNKQYSFDFEGEENKIFMLEKKIKEDRIHYETILLQNDTLKNELNEAKVNIKLLNQQIEENTKSYEKLKNNISHLETATEKKDDTIKLLTEKLTVLESEKLSNINEIERLSKIKSEITAESMLKSLFLFNFIYC